MLTVFETLYDLAVELQSNPSLKSFTLHHCPDKAIVQVRLQEGILHTVMTDESVHSKWAKTRIFCRNYVNRAKGVVTPKQMVSLLATVENLHPSEDERLAALASTAAATFDVKRKKELVFALEKITSREKLASLNHQSYLEWVENRWTYWINQQVDSMDIDELLNDLRVLYLDTNTKIPGIGLPLAANFFADMGVTMFVKPDLLFEYVKNNVTYVPDPIRMESQQMVQGDLITSPAETLRIRGGDCDDQAILMASLLSAVGIANRMHLVKSQDGGWHLLTEFAVDASIHDEIVSTLDRFYASIGRQTGSRGYWFFKEDPLVWLLADTTRSYVPDYAELIQSGFMVKNPDNSINWHHLESTY